MADLTFTSGKVRNASPVNQSIVNDYIAAVAVTEGQALYMNSSGKAALADASAAGTAVCVGIALNDAAINQAVATLYQGWLEGFTLTSLAYGALVNVSDTAGDLDSGGAPTVAAPVGRVMPTSESVPSKLLYIDCSTNMTVLPA